MAFPSFKHIAWIGLVLGAATCQASDSSIRMLIGAPPGGGTDALFRSLAKQVASKLQVSIVPLNLPAAGGSLAIEQAIRNAPDGTTIAAVANSTLTSTPHLMKVSYRQEDYLPLISISAASYTMCVTSSFPAKSAAEFVAALRSNPGKYSVGTDPGIGQLTAGRVFRALGLDARLIPFKGASEIVTALLGGHVDIYTGSIPAILPHVAAGKANCLLLTGTSRSENLPAAASLTDLGIANESTTLTRVIVVNRSTPAEVVRRLIDAFDAAAKSPETRALLAASGDTFSIQTGGALQQSLRQEYEVLGGIAKKLNIGSP